jgi:hypothetical protein
LEEARASQKEVVTPFPVGELGLDPAPTPPTLPVCSIDLHLGDYFMEPLKASSGAELQFDPWKVKSKQVKIGEDVVLPARSQLFATTL